MLCAAIDLNGIVDRCCRVASSSDHGQSAKLVCRLPVVVASGETGGDVLVGEDARDAIESRGWRWPPQARASSVTDSSRVPIVELLARLTDRNAEIGTTGRTASDLLERHLRYLAGEAPKAVLAIPDHLDELGQQRILETLGRSVASRAASRLLWRPVAALIGWAERLSVSDLCAIHGEDALVLSYLGDGVCASRLLLEVANRDAMPLLTPVRTRSGEHSTVAGCYANAREIAKRIVAEWDNPDDTWQALWGTELSWTPLIGSQFGSPEEGWLQTPKGDWIRVRTNASLLPSLAGQVRAGTHNALSKLADSGSRPPRVVLIEGFPTPSNILGQRLEGIVRDCLASLGLVSAGTKFVHSESEAVANGIVAYVARESKGLPTYFDFLPQLKINVFVNDKWEFVPLVTDVQRIPGGNTQRKRIEHEVLIPSATKELRLFLSREGHTLVRQTKIKIDDPPTRDVHSFFQTTQTPGQGYARVEIDSDDRTALGGRPLAIEWLDIEDTSFNEEQALASLEVGQLRYPDCGPRTPHWFLWASRKLEKALQEFVDAPRSFGQAYQATLKRLRQALATWRLGEKARTQLLNRPYPATWTHDAISGIEDRKCYACIGTDGSLPGDLQDHAEAYASDIEPEFLFRSAMSRLETDFGRAPIGLRDQLLLAGCWCYAAAPQGLIQHLRDGLQGKLQIDRWAVEGASRCLTIESDLSLFFTRAAAEIKAKEIPPQQWAKGITQILLFRPSSVRLLSSEQVSTFVVGVVRKVASIKKIGPRSRSWSDATLLLLMLLRFRIVDSDFLQNESVVWADLRRQVDGALTLLIELDQQQAQVVQRVADIRGFLDNRGVDGLIGVRIAASQADSESEDDALEE